MNFNNYVGMGAAHELMEQYEQAVALHRRAFEERPNAKCIYRSLAGALSGAGRMEEAQAAYAEMMRNYPGLTVARFKQAMVFSPAALERMVANLRKLGLPE
jgi:adenylate cyclase